jgi:hypothetical protein
MDVKCSNFRADKPRIAGKMPALPGRAIEVSARYPAGAFPHLFRKRNCMKKQALLFFFLTTVLCLSAVIASAQKCKFEKENEPVIPGGNMIIEEQAGLMKKIAGTVLREDDELAEGATAVLYKVAEGENVFVGWQTVDEKARCCFGKLPPGKYVLRVRLGGMNVTEVYITLDRSAPFRKKKLKVILKLGT